MPKSNDRVCIFIDGSNLYHSLKHNLGKTELRFERFIEKLSGERNLVRTYYYNARVDQTKEPDRFRHQQRFFDKLRRLDYFEVRLVNLYYRDWPDKPPYEKGVDVSLVTDMLTYGFRDMYDIAILVSGDNDYVHALQAVKDHGKHIEVALFGVASTSQQLRNVADKVITMNSDFLSDCWP